MNVRPNMIPEELAELIRKNISLPILCDFLKVHNKPVARSWNELFAKNFNEVSLLSDLLLDVVCFSNKSVFAFEANKFNKDELEKINPSGAQLVFTLNNGSQNYKLFYKKNDGRFYAYSFCKTKMASETHILTGSDLSPDIRKKFWTPDSIVKLNTNVKVTVVDSLIFDSLNQILYVLIDNKKYNFEDPAFEMQASFIMSLMSDCPSLSNLDLIDFYPVIDGIYSQKNEGVVHRLEFECNTGVIRNERLKPGQLDLRNEGYHTKGKEAIGGGIRPFKLGVTWTPSKDANIFCQIGFEINGTRSQLHKQGGMYCGVLSSQGSFNELVFALHRVALYVQ